MNGKLFGSASIRIHGLNDQVITLVLKKGFLTLQCGTFHAKLFHIIKNKCIKRLLFLIYFILDFIVNR